MHRYLWYLLLNAPLMMNVSIMRKENLLSCARFSRSEFQTQLDILQAVSCYKNITESVVVPFELKLRRKIIIKQNNKQRI